VPVNKLQVKLQQRLRLQLWLRHLLLIYLLLQPRCPTSEGGEPIAPPHSPMQRSLGVMRLALLLSAATTALTMLAIE
jgi:hypothetical protein